MSFKRSQVRKENFIRKKKDSTDRSLDRHAKFEYKQRKEELELEIEKSWIRDEAGEIQGTASMTKMHIAYLDWLENYQHEQ